MTTKLGEDVPVVETGGKAVIEQPAATTEADLTADFRQRLAAMQPITRVDIPEELADAVRSTDHTALGNVDEETIVSLCREAASSNPYPNSVCVQGKQWASVAADTLRALGCRDGVAVCAVGERHFPKNTLNPVDSASELGYRPDQLPGIATLEEKLADVEEALEVADIFDMVLNAQMVLTGDEDGAVAEILAVRGKMDAIKPEAPLRVISSTGMLRAIGGEEMVQRACRIVGKAAEGLRKGAIVMKTETGFIINPAGGKFGATVEDIQLMRGELPDNVEIKASGGVSDSNAKEIKDAGADYIGASGLLRGLIQQPSEGGY